MDQSKGWISIYRSIKDHWIWKEKPFDKRSAWIDILLSANHKDNKVLIGKQLVVVKAGSFITSELKLMERWGWSKRQVRTFLELLQQDNMIVKESTKKWTGITVVKWRELQVLRTITEPQADHNRTITEPQADTNNNDNNENNENKGDQAAKAAAVEYFQKNITLITNSSEAQMIADAVSEKGLDAFKAAVDRTKANGGRTLRYCLTVLYEKRKYKAKTNDVAATTEQAEQLLRERKEQYEL